VPALSASGVPACENNIMAVYVDRLTECPNQEPAKSKWRWSHYCHMFADDVDQLHSMAKAIGLKRKWFQDRTDFPHYDLTLRKRGAALAAGAISVDRSAVVDFVRRQRSQPSQLNFARCGLK
jgi:Protein of unknown function (DUF4031)